MMSITHPRGRESKNTLFVLPVALLALAASCRTAPPPPPQETVMEVQLPGKLMIRTQLIFGMLRPNGDAVTEVEWQKFVDDAVALWFPNGFTVLDGLGQWRNSDAKVINERSKVILILHDPDAQTMKRLDDVRSLYCQRFGPQTVMRESSRVWVAY